MRKLILLFLLIISHDSSVSAQQLSWIWAKNSGSSFYELATDISYDKNGQMLVTGTFSSPTLTIGTTTLTNNSISNMSDFFIAKYDTAGNVIWIRSYGGPFTDDASGITSDLLGNIFVTGTFTSDTMVIANDTLLCSDPWGDSADVFIAAFDPLGNPLWATQTIGSGHEEANEIETDPGGNVYVTGEFNSLVALIGAVPIGNSFQGNRYDAFVVKLSPSGIPIWAQNFGNAGDEFSKGITLDPNANVTIAGYFTSDSIVIGNFVIHNTTSGYKDVFLARYNSSGALLWAKGCGGSSDDNAFDIDSDGNGNVYVCGFSYSPYFVFGTDSFLNHSALGTDAFLLKYNFNGTPQWVRTAGGILDDNAMCVHCDNTGNIFMGGSYASSVAYFGNDSLINNNPGYGDIFISWYDQSGNYVDAVKAAGTLGDGLLSLASDQWGGLYAVGSYDSPICTFGTITVPLAGSYDLYVAKVHDFTTSLNEISRSVGIIVSPNPFTDFIAINVGDGFGAVATFYSVDGSIVKTESLRNGPNTLSTSDLSAGMYILQVRHAGGSATTRLVKPVSQ